VNGYTGLTFNSGTNLLTCGGKITSANINATYLGAKIGCSNLIPNAPGTNTYQFSAVMTNNVVLQDSSSYLVAGSLSGYVSAAGMYTFFLELWNGSVWVSIGTAQVYFNLTNSHVTVPFTWVITSSSANTYSQLRIFFSGTVDTNDRASIRFAQFPAF
jgi:hypothetical protein